ncbi:MAG: aldo/keto reductase [Elusimicrobia bacterium]|nr:aldo/keto reductase [Elusimicrobiota bacterium]
MPLDHYLTLGRSGLRVSPFCLGAMTFGNEWGFGSDPKESEDILTRFAAAGGNFIDTANVYTKGHSEKVLGDWLRQKVSRRDRVVLATKFFGSMYPGDPNAGGAGRKSLTAACEQSLRRLQTDYIDLYWMHCWDNHTPIDETMRALDDLVRAGKVRYIGFSDTPAWKCAQAQVLAEWKGWSPLVALQIEYSLLERTVEGELMPMARELGLGVTPWSPLKSGALGGRYTRANKGKVDAKRGAWVLSALNDKAYDVLDVLLEAATELQATPAQVALSWVQNRPGVASTIIGARTVAQLEDNLKALDLTLTAKQVEALDAASAPMLDFPHQFLKAAGVFRSAETTINGEVNAANPLAPKTEAEAY